VKAQLQVHVGSIAAIGQRHSTMVRFAISGNVTVAALQVRYDIDGQNLETRLISIKFKPGDAGPARETVKKGTTQIG
jgi:hypothetical protein